MLNGIDFSKINFNDIIDKVQEFSEKAKEENANKVFTSKVGGGMVSISINGNSEVVDLSIDDSLLEDKDSLEILLISAINDVIKQADEFKKQSALNAITNFNLK